jgi:hypothetical protein
MSKLLKQAELAEDRYLLARCNSAAARAGIPSPADWVQSNRWTLAVTPGWEDAATQTDITDEQILDRVAELHAPPTPPDLPDSDEDHPSLA